MFSDLCKTHNYSRGEHIEIMDVRWLTHIHDFFVSAIQIAAENL